MLLVYTTMPTFKEAQSIARHVVKAGLAAGANILAPMHSVYHWKGAVQEHEEYACLFQSTRENFAALSEAIKKEHSYEVPCIVAMPLEMAEENFAAWIHTHCKK